MTTGLSPSSSMLRVIRFEVLRARALGYYMQELYDMASKELVMCSQRCPKVNGDHVDAFSDVLLLLSQLHIKRARWKEAVKYARQAVQHAKQQACKVAPTPQYGISGPLLCLPITLICTYTCLAYTLYTHRTISSTDYTLTGNKFSDCLGLLRLAREELTDAPGGEVLRIASSAIARGIERIIVADNRGSKKDVDICFFPGMQEEDTLEHPRLPSPSPSSSSVVPYTPVPVPSDLFLNAPLLPRNRSRSEVLPAHHSSLFTAPNNHPTATAAPNSPSLARPVTAPAQIQSKTRSRDGMHACPSIGALYQSAVLDHIQRPKTPLTQSYWLQFDREYHTATNPYTEKITMTRRMYAASPSRPRSRSDRLRLGPGESVSRQSSPVARMKLMKKGAVGMLLPVVVRSSNSK
eukprot:gene32040-38743_t